jgi:hypothetical protein
VLHWINENIKFPERCFVLHSKLGDADISPSGSPHNNVVHNLVAHSELLGAIALDASVTDYSGLFALAP